MPKHLSRRKKLTTHKLSNRDKNIRDHAIADLMISKDNVQLLKAKSAVEILRVAGGNHGRVQAR